MGRAEGSPLAVGRIKNNLRKEIIMSSFLNRAVALGPAAMALLAAPAWAAPTPDAAIVLWPQP